VTRSQLIVQRDGSLVVTPGEERDQVTLVVRQCASLRKIVAGSYVYDIAPAAVWGAAAAGVSSAALVRNLDDVAATPIPADLAARIVDLHARFGALTLVDCGDGARLVARDPHLLTQLHLPVDCLQSPDAIARVMFQAVEQGWPVIDARPVAGIAAPIQRARFTGVLRPYQREALTAVTRGGSGLVLLPCGAGKTTVGVAVIAEVGGRALVLVPSRTVAEQWRDTLLTQTTLRPDAVRVFAGGRGLRQVTIATYHAATLGRHRAELSETGWDTIVYDEVQTLPADSFRMAAGFRSARRLGLTATLVREDRREAELLALVGPTLFEASWLELERAGWIAPARCVEIRLPHAEAPSVQLRYKLAALWRLLEAHVDQQVIVSGTDLAGLRLAGQRLSFPVLTGASSADERAQVLDAFRQGRVRVLGLSRIGSVGIDVPDASVLVQLSGTFGSRQEEAQRLGRILRPRPAKQSWFYTLVTNGTREVAYAERRQRFLVNQGYIYEVRDAADLPRADRAIPARA
jgi:DNA excision repair protein ERCC-3